MINKNHSLSFWLKYIEKFNKKTINFFELKSLAKKLGLLSFNSFIFVVAGTNGKGTTCATLEKLLLSSGYQVGLYTSPHLLSYLERVRINGHILSSEEHVSSFKRVEFERKNTLLTYFEFITLSSLILFKKYSLDVLIIEVGLGGRLDATNIINSNISIITNIGIDHISVLGETRSKIAREKSGIFRKNIISVIGDKNIPNSMIEIAQKKQAILKKIDVDWFFTENKYTWNFFHSETILYNLPMTQVPVSNVAIALSSLYYSGFKIKEKTIRKSISKVQLPGRFQIISFSPYIILDVAHNPDASLYLSKKINNMFLTGKIYGLVGILKDKDISGIISPLIKKVHYWYVAPLKTPRSASIIQLENNFPKNNTKIFNSIEEAYQILHKLVKKEDTILVFGSFLTVSEFIMAKKGRR